VDAFVSDPDGFADVKRIDLVIARGDPSAVTEGASGGAAFRWDRDKPQPWTRTSSPPSWQVLPALCWVDTATTAIDPRRATFAIVVSPIARASSAGEWLAQVAIPSAVDVSLDGLDMVERIEVASWSASGRFRTGPPAAMDLPLVEPATGKIQLGVVSNAPWRIRGGASRFVDSDGNEGFDVRRPDSTLRWSSQAGGPVGGVLDDTVRVLVDDLAPNTSEGATVGDLTLLLRHPTGLSHQEYADTLDLRVALTSGHDSAAVSVPLHAVVGAAAPAASAAIAEISPTQIVAGTPGQTLTVYLWVTIGGGDTGVDRVSIGVPPGFGAPRVTQVRGAFGVPLAFTDSSDGTSAIAQLASRRTSSSYLEVAFSVDAAPYAAPSGVDFGVVVGDSRAPGSGISAGPGNPNILVNSNRLDVEIDPGPLAFLNLTPPAATLTDVETRQFLVATTDAFGNAVAATVQWLAEGGVGFVDASGLFTATAAGSGRVIARSSAVAETASVTVVPAGGASGVRATRIAGGGGALIPGGAAAEALRVRIANHGTAVETLDRVVVSNAAVGPGTVAEMDAGWSGVGLWTAPVGGSGTLRGSAAFSGGAATFDALAIAIPAGDSIEIAFTAGASLAARDGDLMRAALVNGGALRFASGINPAGSWPMVTSPALPVDGMSAAQIGLSTPASGITVGTTRQPVAVLDVPSNGYAPDTLHRVNLSQLGDASPSTDLPRIELWADDGSGGFDAGVDALLGEMLWTGDRWERTGLRLAVPVPGRRLFVTADAAETARAGAVLRLALPGPSDVALGMAGGNSGPVDATLVAPAEVVVSIADRVTLSAAPLSGGTAAPGQRDVPLLAIDAHNTYADPRSLTVLRVQNAIAGPGTLAQRDAELARLELRDDADGDGVLGDAATDPVLASAVPADGRASFSGFSRPIGAGETRRLFVTGDVSATGAADGDRLAVSLASALDVEFAPASVMAAAWPVVSTGAAVVDGMVAAQIGVPGALGVTLGPSDGPVEALDVVVPRNGYLDDELTGVRVVNTGSASSADVAELRLWRDGGDQSFDAGVVDDRDLGPLAFLSDEWRSPILAEPLGAAGARLFVAATVAASPADSATLRLAIPVGGVSTASANQGPRDAAVANPDEILLSTSPLLATLRTAPAASTVGQSVLLRLTVRNVSPESIAGIAPTIAGAEGPGTVIVTGGPSPASADLAPGAEVTFEWAAQAGALGDVRMLASAAGTGVGSGLPRRALTARSNLHRVYLGAADVSMFAVQSMPFAVDRGQTGVVPLSLTFEHSGDADASDIRIDAVAFRLESQSGADVIPASLLSRVALVEGATTYLERTGLEASGGTVQMSLARPVVVGPGNPVTVALHLDVSETTAVPDFRVVVGDSTVFVASDATSGAPVVVRLFGAAYPIRSGLARVLTGARELLVDATPETARVSRGQSLARLGVLRVRNAADPAAGTEVRIGALRFDLADAGGTARRDVDRALARIVARSALGTHADRAVTAADSAGVKLDLTRFVSVPAGAALDVELLADLRADAPLGGFCSTVRDSAWIETRDASTGEAIPVLLARAPLDAGAIVVEAPAETLLASGRGEFPSAAGIGRPGLPALTLALRHPGAAGTSRVRVDSIGFELLDAARQMVPPGRFFDRVVVLRNGAPLVTLFDPPAAAAAAWLALPGILLEPGAVETLAVVVDIDPAAPTGTIEMVVRESGWRATEANLASPVAAAPEAGGVMPFSSGVLRLDSPARRLAAGFESRIPALLPPDGAGTAVARLTLHNTASPGAGPIDVVGLRLVAEDDAGAPIPIGAVVERATATVNGQPWGASALLAPDSASATIAGATSTSIPAAAAAEVELHVQPRRGASGVRFRLGLDRDDVGVVQPSSSLLSIAVEAAPGNQFPFWTALAAVGEATLAASYANFPNPFAAGREATTFAYTLERPSRVTLKIWTLRGELVRTMLEGAAFGPGLRQAELWDGRNGAGRLVANGVYVAELVVEPDGAPAERLLRKVAVVR
jgi:hypothetical protein